MRVYHVAGVQTCGLPIFVVQEELMKHLARRLVRRRAPVEVLEGRLRAAALGRHVRLEGCADRVDEPSGLALELGRAACRQRGRTPWGGREDVERARRAHE